MFPRVGFAVSPLRGRFQALAAVQVAHVVPVVVLIVEQIAARSAVHLIALPVVGVQEDSPAGGGAAAHLAHVA